MPTLATQSLSLRHLVAKLGNRDLERRLAPWPGLSNASPKRSDRGLRLESCLQGLTSGYLGDKCITPTEATNLGSDCFRDSSESRGAQVSRFIWKQASDCQEILRRKGNNVNSALRLRHRRVNSVVGGDISTESHLFVPSLRRPLCFAPDLVSIFQISHSQPTTDEPTTHQMHRHERMGGG
ncbi:hypothetical protein VTN00DRAFT_2258 [Thermoascus crustaceus]|uniref:uncharacterized protein n=1 Tax=Thermoascus crustaceus TaxID=5088 RepID=UPI003743C764